MKIQWKYLWERRHQEMMMGLNSCNIMTKQTSMMFEKIVWSYRFMPYSTCEAHPLIAYQFAKIYKEFVPRSIHCSSVIIEKWELRQSQSVSDMIWEISANLSLFQEIKEFYVRRTYVYRILIDKIMMSAIRDASLKE